MPTGWTTCTRWAACRAWHWRARPASAFRWRTRCSASCTGAIPSGTSWSMWPVGPDRSTGTMRCARPTWRSATWPCSSASSSTSCPPATARAGGPASRCQRNCASGWRWRPMRSWRKAGARRPIPKSPRGCASRCGRAERRGTMGAPQNPRSSSPCSSPKTTSPCKTPSAPSCRPRSRPMPPPGTRPTTSRPSSSRAWPPWAAMAWPCPPSGMAPAWTIWPWPSSSKRSPPATAAPARWSASTTARFAPS
mmetsp:Transcript_26217/g.61876  ORF Transcript_26217/g.61876 Transcript_26217/m.61876 type:complete len:250 (+) Transcript_26217:4409-5158(+)